MSTAAKNVYGKNWRDGETYYNWNELAAGGTPLVVGAGYNNQNWVTAIRFELEGYAGKLSFSWCTATEHMGKGTLNYKLTRQEEPDLIYADHNTVGDGSISPMQYDYTRNTLEIEQILSPGTYYLYLWSGKEDGGYTSVYWHSSGTYKATLTYDAIAGTASTLALSGGVLGQPVTMQITRNNTDFVHTLNWSFGGQSGVIAEKTTDTLVTWTPDADTFGAYIPTASSGGLTVSCTTYYDAQQIGAAQTATLTLSVPSDAAPVLHDGWAAVSHTNDGTAAAGLSACIVGYSKAVATFDAGKVTPKYGAGIKTLTAAMGGSSVTGGGVIGTVSGTANTVTLTATDSRGKSSSQSVTLAAYPYSRPLLSGVTVFRCDSAGAADDSGAFYSAKAAVTYSDAGGEIGCTLTAAVKSVGGSYGDETALVSGAASVMGGWLSDTATYIVRIQAVDTLGGTASVEVPIPTAEVAFHIRTGGTGLGFGKYNEAEGYVDSAWPIKMNGHKITGLGAPTDDGDAVNKVYVDRFSPVGAKNNYVTDLCHIWTDGTYDNACMYDSVVATEDASTLRSSPITSGPFYAIRHVDYAHPHTLVTLREFYPVHGRVWTNMYYGNILQWSGWKESSRCSNVRIFDDNEGGNICVYPPGGNAPGVNFWEIDAFDGNLRIFAQTTDGNYKFPLTLYPDRFLSPPMYVGVEYATMEVWQGKVVYTKLVDMGALTTYKTVTYSDSWVTPIRVAGCLIENTGWATALPFLAGFAVNSNQWAVPTASSTNITVYAGDSEYIGRQCYVQVWYVK